MELPSSAGFRADTLKPKDAKWGSHWWFPSVGNQVQHKPLVVKKWFHVGERFCLPHCWFAYFGKVDESVDKGLEIEASLSSSLRDVVHLLAEKVVQVIPAGEIVAGASKKGKSTSNTWILALFWSQISTEFKFHSCNSDAETLQRDNFSAT